MCRASRVVLFVLLCLSAGLPVAAESPETGPPYVVRVFYDDPSEILGLADFDLFEFNDVDEGYVLVAVDDDGLDQLEGLGYTTAVDLERTERFNRRPPVPAQVPGRSLHFAPARE